MSGTGSSHTEVIVISSDDEYMSEADIVVSNHPLSSRQDTERKHQASASRNAPSTSVVNKSSSSKTPRVSPSQRREDKQMEIDTAPEHSPYIPPTTSPQPPTSRFGLLSPPADSRSTTCTRDNVEHTLQHNSECNTGSTNVQPRLDARNPAHPVTVLPTPPVSSCASPPITRGPRIPPTWLEPEPGEEDDFGARRMPARLSIRATASSQTVNGGGRKPRKVKAKPLEEQWNSRSPGQHPFSFVSLPR
ncbi:uncharacterized protein FOMMEDRAFT_21190 [Fomitiporia mediterranea MF3/22]|uniref:uncharacterized protein n=1 Tax=Fomitiporia mediterranea (strain MF3/22) TaxID=694068 RepID=UPI0004408823|nr:uncharacterized protein FOMMEDRAFT_21190 [Fomitiporia mediterranea MF3/22]EJD02475.1 hypothetical protein FOMMEDRAFT_21190 [Fomitiporia mediterranea MF3/22]